MTISSNQVVKSKRFLNSNVFLMLDIWFNAYIEKPVILSKSKKIDAHLHIFKSKRMVEISMIQAILEPISSKKYFTI